MYGSEALRHLLDQRDQASQVPQEQERPASVLEQIPPDAPMDDATITVWDGERWLAYDLWRARRPAARETPANAPQVFPANAVCVAGDCGAVRVRIVKDAERWLMYLGSKKTGRRRPDFATPHLEHAIRTAEQWYGAPGGGWRAEGGTDGKAAGTTEAADLPPQDSADGDGAGERGHDDLDLGGE